MNSKRVNNSIGQYWYFFKICNVVVIRHSLGIQIQFSLLNFNKNTEKLKLFVSTYKIVFYNAILRKTKHNRDVQHMQTLPDKNDPATLI